MSRRSASVAAVSDEMVKAARIREVLAEHDDPQLILDMIEGETDLIEAIAIVRSEEHTSELQSLMRISYAVFCLKKKKNTLQTSLISLHLMKILYYIVLPIYALLVKI